MSADSISNIVRLRQRKRCRLDSLCREGIADEIAQPYMNGYHLIRCSGQRAEQENLLTVAWEQNPITLTAADD
ncbi:MAG: hypothetical protein ACPL7K_02295 [Armatimonadota bacterium]